MRQLSVWNTRLLNTKPRSKGSFEYFIGLGNNGPSWENNAEPVEEQVLGNSCHGSFDY